MDILIIFLVIFGKLSLAHFAWFAKNIIDMAKR